MNSTFDDFTCIVYLLHPSFLNMLNKKKLFWIPSSIILA